MSRKIVKREREDPFANMERRLLGGRMDDLFSDFFGGSLIERMGRGRSGFMSDPFGDMMSHFDEIGMPETGIRGSGISRIGGGNGQCISQTFVYNQSIGPDGKPKVEKYFNSNVEGIDKQGRRIGQREEMYKNSATGVKKMSEQRMLGDKARKIVRSKHGQGKH